MFSLELLNVKSTCSFRLLKDYTWRFLHSRPCYSVWPMRLWFWVKVRFIRCFKLTLLLTLLARLPPVQNYMHCSAHWLQRAPCIHPDWIDKLKVMYRDMIRISLQCRWFWWGFWWFSSFECLAAILDSLQFLSPSRWLGKLFTSPQLSTVFLIQDGSLNNRWEYPLAAAKICLHCRLD